MKNNLRVTYTLHPNIVNIINHFSEYYNLSKSKFVSLCIEYGFEFMEEELEEFKGGGYDDFYKGSKKINDTQPTTLTLPKDLLERLNYYSTELGVKKSHLVNGSVYLIYEDIQQKLSDDIDDLMKSVE